MHNLDKYILKNKGIKCLIKDRISMDGQFILRGTVDNSILTERTDGRGWKMGNDYNHSIRLLDADYSLRSCWAKEDILLANGLTLDYNDVVGLLNTMEASCTT